MTLQTNNQITHKGLEQEKLRGFWFSAFSALTLVLCLLVLIHRHILRPSHSAAWRISGSPNPIIASRNGLRRPS